MINMKGTVMHHKLDTDKVVRFYEQEFYVLSNFSSFRVLFNGEDFDTAEHCYHFQKFLPIKHSNIRGAILNARSAHDAFKIAQDNKEFQRSEWNDVKFDVMLNILRAKASQHEYVSRKLLETGDRELIEDSWRDDIYGWGPNKDGLNMLGKLWMQVRAELRDV